MEYKLYVDGNFTAIAPSLEIARDIAEDVPRTHEVTVIDQRGIRVPGFSRYLKSQCSWVQEGVCGIAELSVSTIPLVIVTCTVENIAAAISLLKNRDEKYTKILAVQCDPLLVLGSHKTDLAAASITVIRVPKDGYPEQQIKAIARALTNG